MPVVMPWYRRSPTAVLSMARLSADDPATGSLGRDAMVVTGMNLKRD